VLRHGTIGPEAFEPDAYLDPAIRPLMDRVTVRTDDSIEAVYPGTITMRLVAIDRAGGVHEVEIVNPLGHESNPVSWQQVEEKFQRLAVPLLGEPAARAAAERWRALDTIDVAAALDAVVVPGERERKHH
jgi:2-methylcitrate dehydratase